VNLAGQLKLTPCRSIIAIKSNTIVKHPFEETFGLLISKVAPGKSQDDNIVDFSVSKVYKSYLDHVLYVLHSSFIHVFIITYSSYLALVIQHAKWHACSYLNILISDC